MYNPTMNLSKRTQRRLIAYPAILIVLLIGGCVFDIPGRLEARMVYYPSREAFITPRGYQDVSIPTPDGLQLHGWFIPAVGRNRGDPPGPAVLHVHGNAGNIESHADFSAFLPMHGVSVLIFDYRSYGRSDPAHGRLHRDDLLIDTLAALEYLRMHPDVDPDRIGIYGFSLGGVFGLAAAAEELGVRSVCCVAAFSSWKRIAREHVGAIGGVLARRGVDADESITHMGRRPLLLIHGGQDDIVPAAHSQTLADVARNAGVPVELVIIPEADHNDIIFIDTTAKDAIIEFFRRTLGVTGRP